MVTNETSNLTQYVSLRLWIKTCRYCTSVGHNYCSLFWFSYMLRSCSSIIDVSVNTAK
jgi:hypothetical protein